MKRIELPPMRETALGQFMAEPPTPAGQLLRPPPPYKQEEPIMEVPGSTTALEVEYQCPDCGKTFATGQGLGAHRSRSHGYRAEHPKKPRKSDVAPVENGQQARPLSTWNTGADPLNVLMQATFPGGVPLDREILQASLALVEAYDTLVDLATRPR